MSKERLSRRLETYLSEAGVMQATDELDAALGQVLWQVVVEVHAQQHERDGVGVGDVDRLDVVVDADGAHRVDDLESVVQTLLGGRWLAVHVLQVRVDLHNHTMATCINLCVLYTCNCSCS